MSTMSKRFAKYAVASGVNGALWHYMFSGKGSSIKTPFGKVPTPLVGAGLGLAGSMMSDFAHHAVLPHLSVDKKMLHMESAILAPASSAGANIVGAMALNNALIEEAGLTTIAVSSAVSELAGEWVYNSFILPLIDDSVVQAYNF